MLQNIYTIHDSKADAYLPPFFLHSDGMATRSFQDCITDKEHNFGKHPQDYTLFKIGTFNDKTSEIEYLSPIKNLGNGVEYKTEKLQLLDGEIKDGTS
jgi:hypothetical protein